MPLSLTNTGNVYESFSLSPGAHSWPISLSNSDLLVLPGATRQAWLTVTVPAQTLVGSYDVVQLVGESAGAEVSRTLALTTTANAVYAVTLAPTAITATGQRGEPLTYTLRLTNTGNITTTFQVASLGPWASSVSPDMLGPLAAAAGQDFDVYVQVPAGVIGQVTTTVTATVQSGPPVFATAALVTTVDPYRIYLPLLRR